jgi:hypothetical protein
MKDIKEYEVRREVAFHQALQFTSYTVCTLTPENVYVGQKQV